MRFWSSLIHRPSGLCVDRCTLQSQSSYSRETSSGTTWAVCAGFKHFSRVSSRGLSKFLHGRNQLWKRAALVSRAKFASVHQLQRFFFQRVPFHSSRYFSGPVWIICIELAVLTHLCFSVLEDDLHSNFWLFGSVGTIRYPPLVVVSDAKHLGFLYVARGAQFDGTAPIGAFVSPCVMDSVSMGFECFTGCLPYPRVRSTPLTDVNCMRA